MVVVLTSETFISTEVTACWTVLNDPPFMNGPALKKAGSAGFQMIEALSFASVGACNAIKPI